MFDTRNDLPANTRTKVIELLDARLADAIDLGKGPSFIALHELGISRDNDKYFWFLEAHLHAKR